MRTLLWTVSLIGLALWSLLAWGAAGLLGAAQSLAPALGQDPLGLGFFVTDWVGWLGMAGACAILIIWAIGAFAILAGTVLLSRGMRAIGRIAGGRRRFDRSPRYLPYGSSRSSMRGIAARLAPRLLRAIRR